MRNRRSQKSNLPSQTWRRIQQGYKRKAATTAAAKKRRFKRLVKGMAFGIAGTLTIGCIIGIFYAFNRVPQSLSEGIKPPSHPLRQILFYTDGVLKGTWLRDVIEFPHKGQGIIDIDIDRLRHDLEQHGQIRSATVERIFPDTLKIILHERSPFLRIAVRHGESPPKQLLIARDGTFYKGYHYAQATLNHLPYLGGVRLKSSDRDDHSQGLEPLAGMEILAELLEKARTYAPQLYRTWKVVSCKDFDGRPDFPGAAIAVRSDTIDTILFGPTDFDSQLERLVYILRYTQQRKLLLPSQVDLTLTNGQVAVRFPEAL